MTKTRNSTKNVVFEDANLLTKQEARDLGIVEDVDNFVQARYQDSFTLDKWYAGSQSMTFRSEFAELDAPTARALLRANRSLAASRSFAKRELGEAGDRDEQLLNVLRDNIDKIMKEKFPEGAFVKLNSRSPKDVDFRSQEHIMEKFQSEIGRVYEEEYPRLFEVESSEQQPLSPDTVRNLDLQAYVRTMGSCMVMFSAESVLDVLMGSERVFYNLKRYLDYPDHLSLSVVLREWRKDLPRRFQYEFRCFVYQDSMNAISQYVDFVYFNDLVAGASEIKGRIISFFEENMRGKLPFSNYIADLYVGPHSVEIVEINPFHNATSPCLFSWAEDRQTFLGGPLEFRVRTHPPTKRVSDRILPKEFAEAAAAFRKEKFASSLFSKRAPATADSPSSSHRTTSVSRTVKRSVLYISLVVAIIAFLWFVWMPIFDLFIPE